jgi:hypothetical protein
MPRLARESCRNGSDGMRQVEAAHNRPGPPALPSKPIKSGQTLQITFVHRVIYHWLVPLEKANLYRALERSIAVML